MKRIRRLYLLIPLLVAVFIAWSAFAAPLGVSQRPKGIATPYWYGLTTGTVSTYYLGFPTLAANDTAVGVAATQTLTGKTLTTPVIASFYQDAAKTKLMTVPNVASDTLCAIAAAQTLTNKTLTSPAVNAPVINGNTYNVASGTLTTAQVKALNATPITLIAAPAAGYYVVVDEVELFIDYGSAQYAADAGEDFTIEYATSGADIITIDNDEDGFLLGAADARRFIKPTAYDAVASGSYFNPDNADAEAVRATIASSEWITGDSPIIYRISYHVVPYASGS